MKLNLNLLSCRPKRFTFERREKVRLDDLSVSEEVLNETRRGSTVRREASLGYEV